MILGVLAAGLDRAFIELGIRPTLPRLSIDRSLRRLAIAEQKTQRDLPDAALFCAPSGPLQRTDRVPQSFGCLREEWLTGAPIDVPLAQDWGYSIQSARTGTSRWYLRNSPRPLVILVNGWLAPPRLEPRRLWPIERLDQAGFDVVLPPLPWNARVMPAVPAGKFPGRDPCSNIIELARAAGELVRIVGWAREQGHQGIMLCGTSLGAHLAALFATLSEARGVDRLVLDKPLSFLSDPIRWHARGESTWCQHVADRLERVYRAVSPLDRKPTVDPDRIRVIGAAFDQVTPIAAAQAVADHFQVPLQTIRASHLFDPDRSRRLLRLLAD